MKKLIALRFLFSLVIFIAFFIIVTPQTFASHKVFQENFNSNTEGDFPNGWILVNGSSGSCAATWKVKNGMAGIKIANESTCATNIMPEDGKWNNLGNNYVFELDMKFVNGTDHNIAFRFTNSSKWYDIHFQSPESFVLERVPPVPPGGVTVAYSIPNREESYHLKITVQTGRIKMSIDNVEVLDYSYNPTGELEPTGRIALRAGVGADKSSETYFDNIVVTNIDSPLGVPMFKQTAEPWQGQEYDTASDWSAPEPATINRWGCAMTSAAMILKYHGYNNLDATTNLDPGTLNTWLKNQEDGYVEEGFINWIAITRLSKEAKNVNNITSFDALEYIRKEGTDSAELKERLTTDLDNNRPAILEEPGHFIVAKGVHDSTFDINDPYYDRATLNDGYNNTFLSMGRYLPSSTNLSYLMLTINSDVDVVTSASGKRAGSDGTTTFTEIPQSSYYTQQGIKDPVSGKTTKSFKTLMISKPTDGNYTISIATTSATVKQYSLKLYRYKQDGTVNISPITGYTRSDEQATFSFGYKQSGEGNQTAPTDTTPPQITQTKTLDKNKNGKIDSIEVTFARDVRENTVNDSSSNSDFNVEGYKVVTAKRDGNQKNKVTITLQESTDANDAGKTPIVTLKGDGVSFGIKNLPSINNVWNNQQIATPNDGIPPTKPTADIPGDKYLTPQKVILISLDEPNTPTIFYTLDGSDPATSSAKLTYTAPITIDGSSVTLKAVAKDAAGNTSDVLTEIYEIAPKIDTTSITIAQTTTTSFTVTWTTDRLSHSRIVFGTKSKKVKGTDTKYGYDKTTNEATQKKKTHSVTISGLTPGTTYYYRLISRGSPEQITEERSITLPAEPTPTPTSTPTPATASSSSDSSSSSSPSSEPAKCNDEKPKSAPKLISAFPGINTVALTWSEGEDPISYYLVAYGTEPGKLQYGNPNIGGKGMTSFVVENLSGGQTYYFRVRAGNGCTPGDFSNELAATPIGFEEVGQATGFKENVLGVSNEEVKDTIITPSITENKPVTEGNKTRFAILAAIFSFIAFTVWLWTKLK